MEEQDATGDVHADESPANFAQVARKTHATHFQGGPGPIWSRCLLVNGWAISGHPAEKSFLAWSDQRARVRPGLVFTDANDSESSDGILYHQSESGAEATQPTLAW
jgi:hypothetical protein